MGRKKEKKEREERERRKREEREKKKEREDVRPPSSFSPEHPAPVVGNKLNIPDIPQTTVFVAGGREGMGEREREREIGVERAAHRRI